MKRSDYYSVREAAEVMLCSTTFIYRLIKDNELSEFKLGSRHYILKSAVARYIEKHTVRRSPGEKLYEK